jgi:prepilin-type N-terminal cleavage/methylation domain-containing protein
MNNQKGFTIIELIVVVATIAVLTAIIISNVNKYAVKARDVKRKADLAQVKKAMLMYAADHDSLLPASGFGYSNSGYGWANNASGVGSCYSYTLEDVLKGVIIAGMPSPYNLYTNMARDPLVGGCGGNQPNSNPGGYMHYHPTTGTSIDSTCAILLAHLENPSTADLSTCDYPGKVCVANPWGPGSYGMNYCLEVKTQ